MKMITSLNYVSTFRGELHTNRQLNNIMSPKTFGWYLIEVMAFLCINVRYQK